MTKNLNKIYHKSIFRNDPWAKHQKPYGKRLGNKRFRKTGKGIFGDEDPFATNRTYKKKPKKRIKVRIKHRWGNGFTTTEIKTFASIRDAQNSIKRNSVINAHFLKQ